MSGSGTDRLVVVVTGVPGSGKTTLGRALAAKMNAPFVALDDIKERLYASSDGNLEGLTLRLAAEDELERVLTRVRGRVVVDIWGQPGRDTARVAGLLARSAPRVIEVLCRVPAEVAIDRYRRRLRSGPHKPADEDTLRRIREAAANLAPLGIGPCAEVDTATSVPLDPLLARFA